ncbi:tetrahydromethanopterin S-methyltransferase subunit C [Methanolobus zinderi]|jgi:tetrahydromethanopterin S-methyltransferase subunit C|uniref:Tetrahydromethanopterin S-methyltransferase subunit C n=1 Tax=Methanolobus zinderi TaxID=536044 RepID=A0A7D5IQS2_9EURY|nr:tetrahydromethanopterin S-methyltransferase subunit C [Methanolobus zinderi]KXS44687.1 MAG: tetrahydromethanopterin S-methyltransferase subunit C [Methanolobus sp. T82-4]QLC50767.1 tetrahydromethanopterin S-methyltransferase subunit C [Methanolobus zinderi]
MSAGGAGGEAHGGIPQNNIIAFGAVGGLVLIYAAYFLDSMIPGGYMSFLGGLGAICGIVWGAAAVRRVASYGLGTGVPSIGMLALGTGVVAATFGLAVGGIAGPVVAVIAAAVIGLIIGVLANKVLNMGIPIMEQSMTEIATAGTITIIGLSTAMVGTFMFDEVLTGVIATGYIAVIFIAGGLGILHPFNANLGPDEKQDRTLATAFEKGAIAMVVAGVVASVNDGASATLTILVGLIIWYVAFSEFYKRVKRDAFKVTGSGLLPSKEELE